MFISRRLLHPPVQFLHREAEQLRSLGFGNGSLSKSTEREALETLRLLAFPCERFFIWRPASPEPVEVVKQPPERGLTENAKVLAAIRDRLNARAKELLQRKKFPPTDRPAVFPNLRPQSLSRHQEGAGEAMRSFLFVQFSCYIHDHVSKLMGQRKALTLSPFLAIHHNDGQSTFSCAADTRRQAVDIRQTDGRKEDSNATELDKCQSDVWCKLNSVDLNHEHFNNKNGVYIIWHEGPRHAVVYVGQGNIKERLASHRRDHEIQEYASLGLYVTWATVRAQ